MFKRTMSVAVLTAMISVCVNAWGQTPSSDKPEDKVDPARFEAAMGLLEAMNTEAMLAASIDQMLELQVKNQPMLAPFEEVMRKFLRKYMSWEVLKDDLAMIYVEQFSTEELKQISAFYRTPAGQKLANKQPEILQKQAMLGASRVQKNMKELQQAIMEEQAKQTAPQGSLLP